MTLTINQEHIYLGIIFILMIIQVFQWRSIYRIYAELDKMWDQMAMIVGMVGKEIKDLQDKIHDIKK